MAVVEEDEHQPVSSVFFQKAFKFLEDLGYMGELNSVEGICLILTKTMYIEPNFSLKKP